MKVESSNYIIGNPNDDIIYKIKKYMRIIDKFNSYFCKKVQKGAIIFGQNITTGSRISGLTNKIETIKGAEVFNTQKFEASLIGLSFWTYDLQCQLCLFC